MMWSTIFQFIYSFTGMPVRSRIRHYWQNGGMAPTLPSLSHRHGPGMKKLGFVILTYFFLSLAELTEKNIKVLIVLERSMRRHKAFCSCAQRIIHKVNHWHLFKDFTKKCFRVNTEAAAWNHGRDFYLNPICEKSVCAKKFAEFRA